MSDAAEIRKRCIYRVTLVGFAVNLVLSLAKLAAGVFGRSGAMVADAVHSFSDLATDVVVIVFARISAKPRDDGLDYGHGKYETLATIRCIPVDAPDEEGVCVFSGKPSHRRVLFARSY